jgi:putative spermidine/putrescine transport system ATP-binding protein
VARIELVNLEKSFGPVRAVKDLTFTIEDGEFIVFVGPSGCGKTTTLRMIAGFQQPSAGEILFDDTNVTHVPANKRDIGFVFQNYALFPHLSVFENVAYGLRIKRRRAPEIDAAVEQGLRQVDLQGLGARAINELSGGQQQRVALARALITSPQILLLDEPLSALDPFLRLRMRAELKKLQRELGISFIHVTHGQDEAMALADIVVLMNGGRIEQQGSPREIFNHPRTEFTAKFIGGHNVIAIGDETFAVREDRLKLRRPDEAVNGPSMAGTVSEVEYQGTYVRVAIVADGGADISAQLTDIQFDTTSYAVGERVLATWDPAQASPLKTSSSVTVPSPEKAA